MKAIYQKSEVIKNYFVWLLIILATCSLSFGQTENSEFLKDISGVSSGTVLAPGISTALEKPIDPKLYRLGPGDKLEFRVWGIIEVRHILQVGPDGFISIPTIGSLEVAGKTIVEAESLLVDKSRDVYPRSKISFRLTRVRMMKVLISGAVENPGVYELSAIDRLSSLIEASGGFIERKDRRESDKEELSQKGIARGSDKKEEDKKDQDGFTDAYAAQRQIRINNRSGSVLNSVLKVDYLQYKKTGNLNFNPVLEDGDQVHVPIMDVEVGVLRIFGAVKEPGEYEYVNGDSLLDLVDLAGGFKVDALLSDLQIVRFNADDKSKEKIQVNVLENIGQNRGPQLQPDDCVFVREIPDFRVKHHVTVKGEVNFPGVYSIIQDVTTLTDIIEASGGFAERANIKSASVVRKAIAEIEDPEYERLKKMTVGEMNEMEYEYFKTRSREEAPAVVVDFQKLFIDDDKNLDIVSNIY